MQAACKAVGPAVVCLWQDSHNADTRSSTPHRHQPSRHWGSTTALQGVKPSGLRQRRWLKWVPCRAARVFEVTNVGAEPQAHAGADRRDDDRPALLKCQPDAANEIRRAVDAGKALVDLLGIAQVVDEHHDFGASGTGVPTDRRALPIDAAGTGILGVEHSLAIAQAGNKGAAGILTKNIAVRSTLLLEGVLNHAGEPLAHGAEE